MAPPQFSSSATAPVPASGTAPATGGAAQLAAAKAQVAQLNPQAAQTLQALVDLQTDPKKSAADLNAITPSNLAAESPQLGVLIRPYDTLINEDLQKAKQAVAGGDKTAAQAAEQKLFDDQYASAALVKMNTGGKAAVEAAVTAFAGPEAAKDLGRLNRDNTVPLFRGDAPKANAALDAQLDLAVSKNIVITGGETPKTPPTAPKAAPAVAPTPGTPNTPAH